MPSSIPPEQDDLFPQADEPPAAAEGAPEAPEPIGPSEDWEHAELYRAVNNALYALPNFFTTDLVVSGVQATDLVTFNTSLAATIEVQVVQTLNSLRTMWDPEQKYALYRFTRQAQRFPDVILRSVAAESETPILLGIELKGWYILAKEREPSFRYRVTPAVCAPADLLVVFPWVLSNVVSGSPRLFEPYVVGARYAAEHRNWHWQYQKRERSSGGVTLSNVSTFYPVKGDMISDVPVSDKGGNFGRFARTGLMDTYMTQIFREELSGIPLSAWQKFFKLFAEGRAEDSIDREIVRITDEFHRSPQRLPQERTEAIKTLLAEIMEVLSIE
jgi:hypothetical protein